MPSGNPCSPEIRSSYRLPAPCRERLLEIVDELLVSFSRFAKRVIHSPVPCEQFPDLVGREIPIHPGVENLVLFLDVLREDRGIFRKRPLYALRIPPLHGLEQLLHARPRTPVVVVHHLQDVELFLDTREQDLLLLRVVVSIRERPDEGDPREDEVAPLPGPAL